MQTHLDSLLRRVTNHAAQESPGGQKKSSSGSNSSRSSKERAVEEKAKLAELIADAEFLQLR